MGVSFLQISVLAVIALYQRWLSPHQRLSLCPRRLYGGASCSAAIAQTIRDEGLSLSAITSRLAACRQAYGHLQVTGGPRVRGVCCCGPLPIPFRCG